MRISTQEMSSQAVASILNQQSALATTQNQVSSGVRVATPADDPIAYSHILQLQQAQAQLTQFGNNGNAANTRLTLEEQALSDAGTVMQQIRELTVQASNTGGLTSSDQQSIATSISQSEQELLGIANRQDGNGEYLFSGLSTTTQPFVRNSAGVVTYAGDQASRLVQIGQAQNMADSDSGFAVFENIPQGNGTFTTAATSANTGNGVVTVGSVTNKAAWVPDNYTLSFTSPTTWQVTNSSSVTVATGNYTSGNSIAFNGVQVAVTGTPATGDSFSISQAHTENIFTTLDNLVTSLTQPSSSGQLSTALGNALQQIDQATTQFSTVNSSVGTRLDTLQNAQTSQQSQSLDYTTAISSLQNVDFASAVSTLNQQQLGLQAAEQSYAKISQLSLFNYL